jgi:hypothetical protein
MKVKQLIELLQQHDPELEVYVYADHGQLPERAFAPHVIWTDDLSYSLDSYTSHEDEAEEYELTKKAILI